MLGSGSGNGSVFIGIQAGSGDPDSPGPHSTECTVDMGPMPWLLIGVHSLPLR